MKITRKQRSISATDPEWDAIKQIADGLGIPVSKLIIERVLDKKTDRPRRPGGRHQPLPDIAMLKEVLGEILILAAIARENMENRGEHERLDIISRRIASRLNLWGL